MNINVSPVTAMVWLFWGEDLPLLNSCISESQAGVWSEAGNVAL